MIQVLGCLFIYFDTFTSRNTGARQSVPALDVLHSHSKLAGDRRQRVSAFNFIVCQFAFACHRFCCSAVEGVSFTSTVRRLRKSSLALWL